MVTTASDSQWAEPPLGGSVIRTEAKLPLFRTSHRVDDGDVFDDDDDVMLCYFM
jgi:hypothetical protein